MSNEWTIWISIDIRFLPIDNKITNPMLNPEDFTSLLEYSDVSLRDYQKENKSRIYELWKEKRSVMLQMPTGTGKTRLFSSLLKDIQNYSADKDISIDCLVMVHRQELVEQIVGELHRNYGLEAGIIQAGYKQDAERNIQVASVQTLSRRLHIWKEKQFDIVIVDEAHHVPAESYKNIINSYPTAKLLGVTATPYRLSGEGFTDIFEELIISPSVKQFIEKGVLSQYDYYSVRENSEIQRELDNITTFQNGDYTDADMTRVCDNDHIRAQIVETYQKYALGKKGIIYTINKIHNKNLCSDFNKVGIKTVAIDSQTPSDIRKRYIEDFKCGLIDIICNVNIFSEGFDCPDIEFIQLARPTQSLSMYLQQIGRGLRYSKGKEKCLFLDNVGLYNRFGLPSANRKWMYHFLGHDEEYKTGKKKGSNKRLRKARDLDEGNEQVLLIETTTGLKYEKQRAVELFKNFSHLNDLLIQRDNIALHTLEQKFSKEGKSALCFDGNKVSVWQDRNSANFWNIDYYLKNFQFRFEYEPETRHLKDETELTRWLTFQFLRIREEIESKDIYAIKKEFQNTNQDKNYILDMYNRWYDNETDIPFARNIILEQLLSQTYDFMFERDSGNRVFQMIVNMDVAKRESLFSRDYSHLLINSYNLI